MSPADRERWLSGLQGLPLLQRRARHPDLWVYTEVSAAVPAQWRCWIEDALSAFLRAAERQIESGTALAVTHGGGNEPCDEQGSG